MSRKSYDFSHPAHFLSKEVNKKNNLLWLCRIKSFKSAKLPSLVENLKKKDYKGPIKVEKVFGSSRKLEYNHFKSITCLGVPKILFYQKNAIRHFKQFGNIQKIFFYPKRQIIVVYYCTLRGAIQAFQKRTVLDQKYDVAWTSHNIVQELERSKHCGKENAFTRMLDLSEDIFPIIAPKNSKQEKTQLQTQKTEEVTQKKQPKITNTVNVNHSKDKHSLKEKSNYNEFLFGQNIDDIKNDNTNELINFVRKFSKTPATSSEEKYKVLDARDRILRISQSKPKTLKNAKVLVGTCPDMCSEKERLLREYQRQVSGYEMLNASDYKIDHAKAVKQYSRSSADQEEPMSHELRPITVLKMTMSYLINEIVGLCDKDDTNLAEWFHFMWDRTRSIRKDITHQELCCLESVNLIEQCARFHIVCFERLHAEDVANFDPKINNENLTKCLQTLKYMYGDLRQKQIVCKNEAEFRAYVILLNLNNGSFMFEFQTLPSSIQHSKEVKFAYDVYSAVTMNNYIKFFKLVSKSTFLNACILLRYFNQIRLSAISVMVKAYCRTMVPMEYSSQELSSIFGLEKEADVISFCKSVGLSHNPHTQSVILDKENFQMSKFDETSVKFFKLSFRNSEYNNMSLKYHITKGIELEKSYKNHIPHSSFDSNGYLLHSSTNTKSKPINVLKEKNESDKNQRIPEAVAKSFLSKEPLKDPKYPKSTTFCNDVPEPVNETKINFPKITINSLRKVFSATDQENMSLARNLKKDFYNQKTNPFSSLESKLQSQSNKKLDHQNCLETASMACNHEKNKVIEMSDKMEIETPDVKPERKLTQDFDNASIEKIYEKIITEILLNICDFQLSTELNNKYTIMSDNFYDVCVLDLCKAVLNEELSTQNAVRCMKNNLKDDLIAKYVVKWKDFVKKMKIRRQSAINYAPAWPYRKSTRESISELFTPKEISMPSIFNTSEPVFGRNILKNPTLPIEYLVDIGLANSNKKLICESKQSKFWKVAVTWPNLKSENLSWKNEQIIRQYLRSEDASSHRNIKIHKSQFFGNLYINIKHIDSTISEESLIGLDALLFLIGSNEKYKEVECRLTKILLCRKRLMPIPVAFILLTKQNVFNKIDISPLIKLFMDSGYISIYKIFSKDVLDESNMLSLIQHSTLWLTLNNSQRSCLEMDHLKNIIEDSLTEKFWIRVKDHLQFTSSDINVMNNPTNIIQLHNESISQLLSLVTDVELTSYTDFAPEFKSYLSINKKLPSSYEYILDDWIDIEYRTEIENKINSLKLPIWSFPWPAADSSCLCKNLMDYCGQVLGEKGKTIVDKILYDVFVMQNGTTFIDILLHIVKEKIKNIDSNSVIIYDKNRKNYFDNYPWWLKTLTSSVSTCAK